MFWLGILLSNLIHDHWSIWFCCLTYIAHITLLQSERKERIFLWIGFFICTQIRAMWLWSNDIVIALIHKLVIVVKRQDKARYKHFWRHRAQITKYEKLLFSYIQVKTNRIKQIEVHIFSKSKDHSCTIIYDVDQVSTILVVSYPTRLSSIYFYIYQHPENKEI